MINKDELLFVVDENNIPLEPLQRHLVHTKNLWHRTTGVWVINTKKQILCQKRSLLKDTKPGYWEAFFGGHIGPKESYKDNALKELTEELGITIDKENLISYKVLKSDKPTHREFQHVSLYKIDREDTDFPYEKEEIDEIKWIDINTLRKYLIEENKQDWVHKPWDSEILDWIEDY